MPAAKKSVSASTTSLETKKAELKKVSPTAEASENTSEDLKKRKRRAKYAYARGIRASWIQYCRKNKLYHANKDGKKREISLSGAVLRNLNSILQKQSEGIMQTTNTLCRSTGKNTVGYAELVSAAMVNYPEALRKKILSDLEGTKKTAKKLGFLKESSRKKKQDTAPEATVSTK